MSLRSSIKQHLPLFSSKLDSDFNSFKVNACLKIQKEKKFIPIDVPIRYVLEKYNLKEAVI